MKGNGLKRRFFINLGLFRAFFGRKNMCQKLVKSKANPLQKCPKTRYIRQYFFDEKTSPNALK